MYSFIKGKISKKYVSLIKKSFNSLPNDEYLKFVNTNFRKRKFTKVIFKKNKFVKIENTNFIQNKVQNKFLGGILRKYKPIDKKILVYMNQIIKSEFKELFGGSDLEIGFHQIRITCGKNYIGYPVPEGWHRDGFDYVALINFSNKNVHGGITRIRDNINKNNRDTYSCKLEDGEYILINDKKFYHFADPIVLQEGKKIGFRDTLVITIKILK
tara:strand:- start:767 stop:1405 length:639 start_codon:yes stop_codon:yes gene_type:complete